MTSPLFPPLQKGAEDPHNHLIPPHSSPNRSKKGLSFCSLEMESAAVLCCFSLLFPERERERETTRGHPYMTSHIFLIFNPLHPLSVFKIFTVFPRIWCFYCPTSLLRCGHRIWKAEAPLRVFNAEKRRRIRSF